MNVGLGLTFAKVIRKAILPKLNKLVTKAFSGKYLLLTNIGISISLSGLGDTLEQHYEILTGKVDKWDSLRTRNMALSGTSVGIVCHYWYQHLDKLLPGYTLRIVLKKIFIDQVIGSPLCISTFFLTIGILEQSTKEELIHEVKQKAGKLYVAEWIIWPPAQFINFYFLPTKFRVLFDNSVSLGYDIYTSYVKYNTNMNSGSTHIEDTNEKHS